MATKAPVKKVVNGKPQYYTADGSKITKADYTYLLKLSGGKDTDEKVDKNASYSKETKNGKTTYYKKDSKGNKTEISKETYNKATTPTYSKKTVDGKTTYYRTDPKTGKKTKISQAAYNGGTKGTPYKENGKYYDQHGNEIDKKTFTSKTNKIKQTKQAAADKKTVEKSTISWSKQGEWKNDYLPETERLAKKMAEEKKPKLEREKKIKDNSSYVNQRNADAKTAEEITKSLIDGTYYDPNTDDRAKVLREDYIRQGQKAMGDTMAELSKRTGGLANSYAAAVAQSKYNDYMDNLASKVHLDLRQLAENSAINQIGQTRQNANMYDTFNNEYRTGQIQNNQVIGDNNNYTMQEWNAYMNQLNNAFNAYRGMSNDSFNQYATGQQMYQKDKQFYDDLAYRYAALAANQAAAEPSVAVGGYGGGGGGYSGGSGGGGGYDDTTGGTQTLTGRGVSEEASNRGASSKTTGGYGGISVKEGTLQKENETSGSGKGFRDYIDYYDEKGHKTY